MNDPPLYLLAGMGADDRLFRRQRAAFPSLVVLKWIEPRRRETLADYSRRLADLLDPDCPCYIGGVSMGGIVAQEVARHLNARACFLISSVRSHLEIPRRFRLLTPGAYLLTPIGVRGFQSAARLVERCARKSCSENFRDFLTMFAESDSAFLKWSSLSVLQWRESPEPLGCPVYQIHGDADPIFPHRLTRPDVLVPGGSHLLPWTHADEVNRFLREHIDRLERAATEPRPARTSDYARV